MFSLKRLGRRGRRETYLDYAAATPISPAVLKRMAAVERGAFGNPSSLHGAGKTAEAVLENARTDVSEVLGCRPEEIIFTAGGSESVNLAVLGVARQALREKPGSRPHVITTAIEHHAVLRVCEELEWEGVLITRLPVDEFGFVRAKDVIAVVTAETVLVSVMYANNEVGSIQPIAEIGRELRKKNKERAAAGLSAIVFHTDACQASGFLDMRVGHLGVDLLSLNGGKIYGPKQSGVLYARSGVGLQPLVYGGGQERGLRSGTENVAAAAGLALAFQEAQKVRIEESERLAKLRDYAIKKIAAEIPDAKLNGPEHDRLPNNVNFSFDGVDGEALVLYLDAAGISASTGSACSTQDNDPSHVILAMGGNSARAKSSLRLTFGTATKKSDVDYAIREIRRLVKQQRNL